MMKRRTGRRILSVLLALVMMLSLLPASVFASDTVTARKISSADQLTSGQYVLVNEAGYAPTVLDGGWVTPTAVTASGDTVEVAPSLLWTITVTDGGVTLTDSKGQTIAPKGGDTNGIKSGSYTWTAACSGGTFTFAGQDTDTVTFSGNSTPTSGENRFRAYKNSTVTGKYSSSYPCHFTLYKYDAAPAPDPTPDTLRLTQVSELKDGMEVVFEGRSDNSNKGGYLGPLVRLNEITSGYAPKLTRFEGDKVPEKIVWILCELDSVSPKTQYKLFNLKNKATGEYLASGDWNNADNNRAYRLFMVPD